MLKSLTIERLRGVAEWSLSGFGRYTALVAAPGTGKTTILEAVAIGASNAHPTAAFGGGPAERGILDTELDIQASWQALLHKGERDSTATVTANTDSHKQHVVVSLPYRRGYEARTVIDDGRSTEREPPRQLRLSAYRNRTHIQSIDMWTEPDGRLVQSRGDIPPLAGIVRVNSETDDAATARRLAQLSVRRETTGIAAALAEVEAQVRDVATIVEPGGNIRGYADIGLAELVPIGTLSRTGRRALELMVAAKCAKDQVLLIDDVGGADPDTTTLLTHVVMTFATAVRQMILTTSAPIDQLRPKTHPELHCLPTA